jgi:hypothetical protein
MQRRSDGEVQQSSLWARAVNYGFGNARSLDSTEAVGKSSEPEEKLVTASLHLVPLIATRLNSLKVHHCPVKTSRSKQSFSALNSDSSSNLLPFLLIPSQPFGSLLFS